MDKNIVIQDNEGKVVRVFKWDGRQAQVIQRKDTKRVDIVEDLDFFFDRKIDFVELGHVSGDSFVSYESGSAQSAKTPVKTLSVGQYGQLALVSAVEEHHRNEKIEEKKNRLWMLSLLLVLFLFLVGAFLVKMAPSTTPKIEQELKQEVVKIVKNVQKAAPRVVQPKVEATQKNQETKVSPSKIAGLKRMGALSALGSLTSGKNKGGLDISAAESSAGPGMGGTQGSGGAQTSLYAKGITGVGLGVGNNVNGGGGYGTKGKGGGQAGYGKLALTGSSGASPIPLSAEANVAAGLDRDQIAAVINRNMGQVTYCYEQGLSQDSSLSGRVAIDFIIGGTGLIKTAKVNTSSLNSKQVEDCIVMRLKTWKFPVPEGGVDVDVTFPFKLARAGGGQ